MNSEMRLRAKLSGKIGQAVRTCLNASYACQRACMLPHALSQGQRHVSEAAKASVNAERSAWDTVPACDNRAVAFQGGGGHRMKMRAWGVILLVAVMAVGCRKKQDQTEAIRAGILKHLGSVNSLNVSAMEMTVTNVNIRGKQATATAEFRVKSGSPAGAAMQVSYVLEKQNDEWVVVKKETVGGDISHPATDGNTRMQTAPQGTTQDMPNFQDVLHPGSPNTTGELPPGHPPVNPATTPNSNGGGSNPKAKQP